MFTILCILGALSAVIGLWYQRRIVAHRSSGLRWPVSVVMFRTSDGRTFEDHEDAVEHQARINCAYWKLNDDGFR